MHRLHCMLLNSRQRSPHENFSNVRLQKSSKVAPMWCVCVSLALRVVGCPA